MHDMTLRAILAEEIKKRRGPQSYLDMLANRWMEIDNELPPELSAALAAMRRVSNEPKRRFEIIMDDPDRFVLVDNESDDPCPVYATSAEAEAALAARLDETV